MLLDNYRILQGLVFTDTMGDVTTRSGGTYTDRLYGLTRDHLYNSIMIGTSDTPVDRAQYDLVEPVTDDIVESNQSTWFETGETRLKTFARFSSVVTNNGSNAITIREIGLVNKYADVLLIREVVSPYVLEPGESVLLSISIE